jgi:hypothetical protein
LCSQNIQVGHAGTQQAELAVVRCQPCMAIAPGSSSPCASQQQPMCLTSPDRMGLAASARIAAHTHTCQRQAAGTGCPRCCIASPSSFQALSVPVSSRPKLLLPAAAKVSQQSQPASSNPCVFLSPHGMLLALHTTTPYDACVALQGPSSPGCERARECVQGSGSLGPGLCRAHQR